MKYNCVKKKVLFVVNTPGFFLSHRLQVALSASKKGYEVHVATAYDDDVEEITGQGFTHHSIALERSGQNPIKELGTVFELYRLFRRLNPSLVHLITIKPVLYGGIAARFARVTAVVAAVSGLGTVFTVEKGFASLRRKFVGQLYRLAFQQKRLRVIFQNPDDRDVLLNLRVLKKGQARMIRGSGVDLAVYPVLSEPTGIPVVAMAARLLRDKGVYEFVEAARLLKARNIEVRFRLIGSPDPGNPTSVSQDELDIWNESGVVEVMGYRTDIPMLYSTANIVCLPSCYGEGLPKTLVEAAACGRAVVTTDHPGCRDAIEPGVSGLLVPVRNAVALADAIQFLLEAPERRKEMGLAGRRLAEQVFAIESIVGQHLAIYDELLKSG